MRVQLDKGTLHLTADNPDLGVAHQELEIDFESAGRKRVMDSFVTLG